MLPVRLKDSEGVPIATSEQDRENRLHVAVSDRYRRTFQQPKFRRIDNGQFEMAINGLAVGSTLDLWDGTGALDTGADWTLTAVGAESPTAMHSGTNGWDTGVMAKGDVFEISNTLQSVSAYDVLNFWLQPQSFPAGSQMRIEWRDAGGRIGNRLNVETYVAMTVGTWQLVSIPMLDFAVTSDVTMLRIKFDKQAGQHHWIDDLQLVASAGGGPFTYRASRQDQPFLDVHTLTILVAGASTGWAVADFATINGGLAAGLLVKFWDYFTGEVFWYFNLQGNIDLFGRTRLISPVTFFDSEHLILLDYDLSSAPARLEDTKVFDITVRDNLSSLVALQGFVTGGQLSGE